MTYLQGALICLLLSYICYQLTDRKLERMSEVGVEIVRAKEVKESGIKYLNINVSNSEVERNPDIVRLCADTGILEYVKPKADVLNEIRTEIIKLQTYKCFEDTEKLVALDEVLQIIDKYRGESEGKE